MRPTEKRVDVRVYMLPEERDCLKNLADEQGISLSELIYATVCKKYKLQGKKARSENLASKIAKNEMPKQEPLDAGPSKKEQSLIDELESVDVPVSEEPPQDVGTAVTEMTRDEQEARLKFLKGELHKAFNGERLPTEVFNAYMQERDQLRAILHHK